MSTPSLSRLPEGFVEAVLGAAATDGPAGLPLFHRDNLPMQPPNQYGVVDHVPTGYGWDPTLERGAKSGVVAVAVSGVGDRRAAALWVLDQVRRLVSLIDPSDIALSGDTTCTCVWSEGPPSPPVDAGNLATCVETYYLHLEAL